MILRSSQQTSQQIQAVLGDLAKEKQNQRWLSSRREEANAENEEEEQDQNVKEPSLDDLPKHTIDLDNPDYNRKQFDIVFFDYNWPTGIPLEHFAEEELQGAVRVHVYAPMITDANLHLNQKCHNGFSGYETCNLLRNGTRTAVKKGAYAYQPDFDSYPGKMEHLKRHELFIGMKDANTVNRIKPRPNKLRRSTRIEESR